MPLVGEGGGDEGEGVLFVIRPKPEGTILRHNPWEPKAQSLGTEGLNLRYPRSVPWDSSGTEGLNHLHYRLQWSATASPRQRGVSPGGGGGGEGATPPADRVQGGGGSKGLTSLSKSQQRSMLLLCTIHVH